ncbi:HugZ protein [Nitrincola sp. A-D6]|uniref:heme utilization protein HutZ n=1 Tax=Nitrincola sp. A-D6 TaxID=1545442 RepID=UPI00051FE0BB|nr:heme utilization protein HutZ [Nitrincola sp. A-D6]KGK43186.1 HugZ protein [Nitrincola sp. A-D6]
MNEDQSHLQERLLPEVRVFRDSRKTLVMATLDQAANPNVSYAPFALQKDGYYVLVSEIARHGQNLQLCNRVSIMLIEDESETRQIYARKRLTFDAVANEVSRDSQEWQQGIDALRVRQGNIIDNLSQLGDFHLYRLIPEKGLYVKGFGQAFTVSGDELIDFVHLKEGHRKLKAS